jgi:20S proteasome subunit alpha 6
VNTQEYGRRPYGVGFLVVGHDASGPHLYEFSPSGNSHEYYAMSIGARSQSAKTYLEKHYERFADCTLDELITHGLHALRETLQQDKELTPANTSIGIVGPAGAHEGAAPPGGAFRILEGEPIAPYLATMTPKETGAGAGAGGDAPAAQGTAPTDPAPAAQTGPAGGAGATDEDVQMEE